MLEYYYKFTSKIAKDYTDERFETRIETFYKPIRFI